MNVRTHRTMRDWSIAELAKRSGVSQPTIERIEAAGDGRRSEYDPRLSRVVAIADALGVSVDALVHERAHGSNLPEPTRGTPRDAVKPHTNSTKNNGTARGDVANATPRADQNGG